MNITPIEIQPPTAEDKQNIMSLQRYAQRNGFQHFHRHLLDITGAMHGFSHPVEMMAEVLGFDGSSLSGYKAIQESDMGTQLLPQSAFLDRTNDVAKLRLLASIYDPVTKQGYNRDPITIAQKAVQYLQSTGIADTAHFGPEPEFFIFDHVEFDLSQNFGRYKIDSAEGAWNSGRNGSPNLGYRPGIKKGYCPAPPVDSLEDLRAEMMQELHENGIIIETGHHEVATAGQGEIDMQFADLLTMSSNLVWFKHVIKNIAAKHGKTATFMPKPLVGDNGSGMHTHQSLWKNGVPLFAGKGYAGLSELALHYIAGILKHATALCAFTNPSLNSYKRIVPHCEAPVNLIYSARNRSAAIRIPQYDPENPKATRIEVRFPDPLASGYVAFSAMLMAGLDGIQRQLHPGEPFDKNVYEHSQGLPQLPGSLSEALDALEKDHDFLLQGGVFSTDFLEAWISLKKAEIEQAKVIPTPIEFQQSFMG